MAKQKTAIERSRDHALEYVKASFSDGADEAHAKDRRCGTCRWWELDRGKRDGDCSFNTTRLIAKMQTMAPTALKIGEWRWRETTSRAGRNCPTWERKKEPKR